MSLNIRGVISGLRSELAEVEAAIAIFERLSRADEEFRRVEAARRLAKKCKPPNAADFIGVSAGLMVTRSVTGDAMSEHPMSEYDARATEVSSVIWK